MMDSFRTDESMTEISKVEEENPMKLSARRMETIEEDPEAESRKTEATMSNAPEATPASKPADIKKPKLTTAASLPVDLPSKPAPVKPATVLKKTTMVSQIKTSDRRVSNIDRLKLELAKR